MTTLFDTDEDGDADTVAAPELATPRQVRLLEGFNYRKEAVRLWTRERAETVLRSCQREERIAARRADAKARAIDASDKPPEVPQLFRALAADYVEQTLRDGDAEELTQALMYSLYVCTADEARRLAGHLVRLWRAPAGPPVGSDPAVSG